MKPAKTIVRNNHCKDVLVVDQAAIFRAEERKCLREQTKLDMLRRELENFEQLDQPAFVSWLYGTFGRELTQLRELRDELARNFTVLRAVENEVNVRRTTFERAFERVSRRQPSPAKPAPKFDADAEMDFEAEYEPRPERDLPSTPKPKPASGNLKDCYRELVRRLHPDLNDKLTTHQRNLWHEVQEAYQNRDLERLEQLSTMAGVLDESPERQSTLADLKKMLRDLRQASNEMGKAIREAKQEPEWQFRQVLKMPARLAMVRNQMALEIAEDMETVQAGLAEFKVLFEGWQRPAEQTHRRGHRPGKQGRRARGRGRR